MVICVFKISLSFQEVPFSFNPSGIPPGERDFIHGVLLMTSDFVEASTFERAQHQSMRLLQREWLHFLKDDLKTFLKFVYEYFIYF